MPVLAWRAVMDRHDPDRDNLTRENVIKQAASLKYFTSEMLLPGIPIDTSPGDYFPIEQMQLMRFTGESWELFGDAINGEVGHERGQ